MTFSGLFHSSILYKLDNMETADIDLWDVFEAPGPEQTFHSKSDMMTETHLSTHLRLSETSGNLAGVSSMSSGFRHSPTATQHPENKESGQSRITLAPETPETPKTKTPEPKMNNSKLAKNKKDEARESLPPCGVCGAKSSGFHFGVMTCESCKVFFRRSVARDKPFFCQLRESCEILPGNRTDCPYCRLKKCLQVGMSKEGIKKGRYSFIRKQNYQDSVEKRDRVERQKQEEENRRKEEHLRKLEATIERLKNLHDRHLSATPEVLEKVRIRQRKKEEYLQAMEEAVGPTPQISPNEAADFYKSTGVDITGYKEYLENCSKTCPKRFCAAVIQYLKEMDEYMSLSLQDRIAILKGSYHDVTWLSLYDITIHPECMLTCLFCGMCLGTEQFGLLMTKDELVQLLRPPVILKELRLTNLELAILKAFVFFDTSKCSELEEPEKVNQIQNHFLECLLHVLEENRGASNAMKSFGHIIHALTEMRTGREINIELLDKVVDIFGNEVKVPKIIAEVYDLPDCLVEELETDISNLQIQVP